jgi:hypothetical protein
VGRVNAFEIARSHSLCGRKEVKAIEVFEECKEVKVIEVFEERKEVKATEVFEERKEI